LVPRPNERDAEGPRSRGSGADASHGEAAAEVWRCIESFDSTPDLAMGLDEVLLSEPSTRPTLRVYTWLPEALSLGYFQRIEDVPAARRIPDVVRRITGGGAIHHHRRELTFSISADAGHPLYRGEITGSYTRVHGLVMEALRKAGLASDAALRLAEAAGGLRSDLAGTGMCFHASAPLDIVWGERKGVGSAQRRTRGRVLHHGSIKLGPSPFEPDVATAHAAGVEISTKTMAHALRAALAEGLGVSFVDEPATPPELARARELGARYTSPEFVFRR